MAYAPPPFSSPLPQRNFGALAWLRLTSIEQALRLNLLEHLLISCERGILTVSMRCLCTSHTEKEARSPNWGTKLFMHVSLCY
jgi:hypothetical protein